jgi:predicted ATPase
MGEASFLILTSVGIANFRSIGEEKLRFDPRKRMIILAGPNNSGKSTLGECLVRLSNSKLNSKNLGFEVSDHHHLDVKNRFQITLYGAYEEGIDHLFLSRFDNPHVTLTADGSGWLKETAGPSGISHQEHRQLMAAVLNSQYSGTPSPEQRLKGEANILSRLLLPQLTAYVRSVAVIPAFREIQSSDSFRFSGRGAIGLLAKWKSPEIGKHGDLKKFSCVLDLARDLLNEPNLDLDVPPSLDKIIVSRGKLRLDLSSFGSGTHQLIILAIAVLSQENTVFCLEEPEIHLHPRLQKRLLRFLLNETRHNYIVSTHSPFLLQPNASTQVISCRRKGTQIEAKAVECDQGALDLLSELGVSASDILQARSVIWVEGPSDLVYIRKWLEILRQDLTFGSDYSVMFYGGSVRKRVGFARDDNSVTGLVNLLRINQRSAIVMDSDRGKVSDSVSDQVQRLESEGRATGSLVWTTWGREIENYLPEMAIRSAYEELHGAPTLPGELRQFGRIDPYLARIYGKNAWRKSWAYSRGKVDYARVISKYLTPEDFDGETARSSSLKATLDRLVAFLSVP